MKKDTPMKNTSTSLKNKRKHYYNTRRTRYHHMTLRLHPSDWEALLLYSRRKKCSSSEALRTFIVWGLDLDQGLTTLNCGKTKASRSRLCD